MGTYMTNQGKLHSESFATDVALVWTETSVDATVTFEIICLGEGFATFVTLEWSDASMNELMP